MQLFVWNQHSTQPVLKYCEHTAAVKAIAWSPHLHGLLASGGGTADRCIRFWNTTTNSHLSCMDTGSQVKCLFIIHFYYVSPVDFVFNLPLFLLLTFLWAGGVKNYLKMHLKVQAHHLHSKTSKIKKRTHKKLFYS